METEFPLKILFLCCYVLHVVCCIKSRSGGERDFVVGYEPCLG